MQQINIHQAKTQFSKLLASVEKGGEIIIARYGEPIACPPDHFRPDRGEIPGREDFPKI
ncbi:MAG: type II toxin-antitoxin system Phd/YefM family antitoxin [Thermodesulfobacteriota bacterium]